MNGKALTNELKELERVMAFGGNTYRAEVCRNAADYISRLEAVVRALDDALRDATAEEIAAMLDVDRGLAWGKLVAARSRVNLPPLTQTNQAKDVDDGFGTSATKCGDDCTLQVNRPGDIRCDGSGAKCPNREATNGNT